MHFPTHLKFYSHCIVLLSCFFSSILHAADFPGGFIEQPGVNPARSLLTQSQIQNLVPQRGKFTFPAPYNTEAIRLTNADDCNNADCLAYVGYSYWSNSNNHIGSDTMLIFMSMDKNKGGAGPSLIEYNKVTDAVQNLGPIFDATDALSWATGEGWYFSASMPNALYLNSGANFIRHDVSTGESSVVFNVENLMRNGLYIWQAHSSADDRVHSVAVRDSNNYQTLGCMVYWEDTGNHNFYSQQGDFDECQIDKSGDWLLIKENVDGIDGEDNRIINLQTGQERILLDSAGAAGHSDLGYGYMIASDNWAPQANTQKLWKFDSATLAGIVSYSNTDWNAITPAHVSHHNAKPYIAPEEQFACGSSANRNNSSEANEIICFGLDASNQALVVAPVMTDLNASGGGNDYGKYPKGNLDISGQYFIWTSNMGGNRLDAFLVKVPGQLLNGNSGGSSLPPPDLDPTDLINPVQSLIKATNITSQSALISWMTNKDTVDVVQYGLSINYNYNNTQNNPDYVNSHSASLANLLPDTLYHYRIVSKDINGNVTRSGDFTFTTIPDNSTTTETPEHETSNAPSEDLSWSGLVNTTSNGNTLTKTAGCDGCEDATASSQQILQSGDGYLEFTVYDTQKLRVAGLSAALDGTYSADINFALSLQGGYAEVRENGAYRSDTAISSGDVLRVSVQSGVVYYLKNGDVFYTSTVVPVYSMKAYFALLSSDSTISNVMISTGSTVSTNAQQTALTWDKLLNATANGNSLSKTAGCDGCDDAGASSQQILQSGDGYLEFTVYDTQKLRVAGLSKALNGTYSADINFALSLQGGYAEVRENGIYRADTAISSGDVLRVSVQSGKVLYLKNGDVFYTSTATPAYPMKAYFRLLSSGSTISDASTGIAN